MWTAEEDRHGAVLHDYLRDTRLLNQRRLEEMQYSYLESGFHPDWDKDPYRVFVVHHPAGTGDPAVSQRDRPRRRETMSRCSARSSTNVAIDEARHFAFYRTVFEEILKRDPDQALHSASFIMPSIEMPGHTMPGFREIAEVIRRSGIYGPRDYLRIVQEQIQYWRIETLTGLGEMGRQAQEKIVGIPDRLQRASPSTSRSAASPRHSPSTSCSIVNSRWTDSRARKARAGLLVAGLDRWHAEPKKAIEKDSATKHPADPAQADAEELGRRSCSTRSIASCPTAVPTRTSFPIRSARPESTA